MNENEIAQEIFYIFRIEDCMLEKWLIIQRCYNLGFNETAKRLERYYNAELSFGSGTYHKN